MATRMCLFLTAAVIMLSQSTNGFPKDSGLAVIEEVHGNNDAPKIEFDEPKAIDTVAVPLHGAPHRMACVNDSDEPVEDTICQEHCLPKGYSYGLCISKTCTCL